MKKQILLIVAAFFVATCLQAADSFKFQGREVSPDTVLAKIHPSKGTKSQVSQALSANPNIASIRGFERIPSIVVIDLRKSAAIASAQPSEARDKARQAELARQIAELQATGMFDYVEPDYIVYPSNLPNDAAFSDGRLWGLRNQGQNGGVSGADIDAVGAWQTTTGSSNVVVAVIDTGIRYTHTDLAANMWVNPDEIPGNGIDDDGNGYIDDIHGINAVEGNPNPGNPMDTDGHGTHCAGTIGAVANGGGPHVGVAWNVRLMALKFLDPSGQISDAIKCIDYAIAEGADILSNSWGGGGRSQALADAIERANSAGMLFVAAAGNEGTDNDQIPHFPANYENANVVSVAALDRSDNLASFSCFGATTVDLGAPGVAIFSSTSDSDTSYEEYSGTSMATPHVSGVAALIKSAFPGAGVTELKQRLLGATRPIPSLVGKCVSGGALDAAAALAASADGVMEITVSSSPAPARAGSTVVFRASISDLYPVTGASVAGTFAAQGPIPFSDNGQSPDTVANDGIYAAQFNVPQTTLESLTLSLDVTAAGKQPVSGAQFQIPVASPPPNDNFENRIVLANGTTSATGTSTESTSQPGEPLNPSVAGGKTVWWSWTPSFSGTVSIDTVGSNYDTTLAVYSGSELGNLVLLGANDDAIGLRSQVTFEAVAGTQYHLQVDGYIGASGSITLNYPNPNNAGSPPAITLQPTDLQVLVGTPINLSIEATNAVSYQWHFNGNPIPDATSANFTIAVSAFSDTGTYRCDVSNAFGTTASRSASVFVQSSQTAPVNDNFAAAAVLIGNSGSEYGSNVAATSEPGEPDHAGVSLSDSFMTSVWWTWTAPESGELVVDTSGSGFDTTLAVYIGDSVDSLTELASNDDYSGTTSRVALTASAGTTYRIAVAGYRARTGSIVLNHVLTPVNSTAPANDNFADRILLAADWTTANGTNAFATGESGEPDHASDSSPLQSVWWEWTPAQSGLVTIDTFGSDFDTTLAVYTGTGLGDLQTIRANDQFNGNQSRVQFPAEANTTYFIAVDGWQANTGLIVLNRSLLQPPLDIGANYGGVWEYGSNGGTGFGAWQIFIDQTDGTAAALIADPASSGISGMSAQSFMLSGMQGLAFAQADRSLNDPLEVGQSLSLQWGINWDGNRGELGNKGFNLYAGGVEIVNVNNAGTSAITLNGVDVGFGYGTQAMTWTFERISFTELKVTANDRDGDGQFTTILNVGSSAISSFRLYASHMDTGDNRRSFYDNFIVSAAPATIAVSPGSISGLSTYAGYPSSSQAIIVNAENLTQSLVATAPWGFAISSDNSNFAPTAILPAAGGIVSSTIYIRIAENASVGSAEGILTLASYGAETVSIPLSGTVSAGYDEGYSAGYTAGFTAGSGGGGDYNQGFNDGIAHLVGNPSNAESYGLYTTDAILDMNLGGLVIHGAMGGTATLRLQLQSTPDLGSQPFQNDGDPIEIPIQMDGTKGFLRVRALGPQ